MVLELEDAACKSKLEQEGCSSSEHVGRDKVLRGLDFGPGIWADITFLLTLCLLC